MRKNKFLVYLSLTFIFLIMFAMNLAVLPFNFILSLINFAINLVLILIICLLIKNYEKHLFSTAANIRTILNNDMMDLFDSIPIPIAIVSENNLEDIIFYNSFFSNKFTNENQDINTSLNFYLNANSVKSIVSLNGVKIKYKNKELEVYSQKIDNLIVIYFLDRTESRYLKQMYINTRPCVGLVLFDNEEELSRYATDQENSQILINFENILRDWINGAYGILAKLNDGKYLIIFEEKYLKSFITEKFKIIDKAHNARLDDRRYATISIGISRGAKNFAESINQAKSALNMSLGRGGDQVSVKHGNSYEFFGGNSQGLEKRSKVKSRIIATALLEKIESSDNILIMGHRYSDFDSIGSAAALWSVCKRLKNKNAFVVVNRNESMASQLITHLEKFSSSEIFITPSQAQTIITENSLLIIVDTHALDFLESPDLYTLSKNIVVIDHHRMIVNKIENALIFFHEPFASSTCEMITELIQYMGDKYLKKSEAECLLAGIILDTKNFSLKSGIRTFEAAAYLKKMGADNSEVKKMFSSSIETYKLKYNIISNAHVVENCAIARSNIVDSNTRVSCAQAADELLNIKNIKASFVLFSNDDKVNISARSLGEVNVQTIMESLGGGGHQTMAATQITNITLDEAEKKLIEIIKQKLTKTDNEMRNK